MDALMTYHLPGLFSLRTLTSNAFAARSLICPSPSTVKMAVLAALLRQGGDERGQEHLDWLAPLGVAWAPPARLAVSAVTVRVWKEAVKQDALVSSVGMREYVHFDEPFGLAMLDVPEERQLDLEYGLTHLRALGNAESIVQPLGPVQWIDMLPDHFIQLRDGVNYRGDIAVMLDDLGPAPSFERLSVYREAGAKMAPRLGEDRIRLMLRLPLRVSRRSRDGYLLERIDG